MSGRADIAADANGLLELPSVLAGIPRDVPRLWASLAERFERRRISAPRFVIHGGYGKDNMGDDAILDVIRGRVRAHFPDARIHVVSHGPERVASRYPDITASHFKSLATLRAAVASDVYIIGGGGIVNRINAYSGNMVFKVLDPKGKVQFLMALLAGWTGAFTLYYAIGAESFPDAAVRGLTRFALQRATLVSVREPRTESNLRAIGVTRELVRILDPALSLAPAPAEESTALLESLGLAPRDRRRRPLVGMNLRWVGDPAVDNENSLSQAARTARWLAARGYDVLFLPISQHPAKHLEDDLDFGRRLRDSLDAPEWFSLLEMYPHPRVYMALLGECDLLVLSRLHAVILGTMMRVPILTISYDDKVAEFVKLSGQESRMIALEEFSLERIEPLLLDLDQGRG